LLNLSHYFSFHATATSDISPLSLHDALPICLPRRDHDAYVREKKAQRADQLDQVAIGDGIGGLVAGGRWAKPGHAHRHLGPPVADRKSTRLNSSHVAISYAVFCLKKKNT